MVTTGTVTHCDVTGTMVTLVKFNGGHDGHKIKCTGGHNGFKIKCTGGHNRQRADFQPHIPFSCPDMSTSHWKREKRKL